MGPDFLILGAAKAATTWLCRELGRHPRIYVAAGEIHYFTLHAERPWSWYEGHFAERGHADLAGENSNTYLFLPEAPGRIAAALPDVRLIAVLRHPVERAYSGYCMQYQSGRVSARIEEHLDPANGPSRFLVQGLYCQHLSRYLDAFDRSQLHVSFFDDLAPEPSAFVSTILAFLGISSDDQPAPGEPRNVRRQHVWPRALRSLAEALERRFPETLQRLADQPLGAAASRLLSRRRVDYPPLEPDLRQRMCDFYASDIERLESLLDRDLTAWRS